MMKKTPQQRYAPMRLFRLYAAGFDPDEVKLMPACDIRIAYQWESCELIRKCAMETPRKEELCAS